MKWRREKCSNEESVVRALLGKGRKSRGAFAGREEENHLRNCRKSRPEKAGIEPKKA